MGSAAKIIKVNGYTPGLETRRRRRAAVNRILAQLKQIIDNEVHYRDNTPNTMRGSEMYDNADYCIRNPGEAFDIFKSAYEH